MNIFSPTLQRSSNLPGKLISDYGYCTIFMILITGLLFPLSCLSQGQFADTPTGSLPTNMLGGNASQGVEMNLRDNGFVTQLPGASGKTKGSSLLYEQWLLCNLDFGTRGKAEGLYIRYDILNSIVNIRLKDKIKSIDGSYIERFSLTDSLGITHFYVNCNQFNNETTPLIGFFEILAEGKYQLFRKTDAVIIEANYNQALDLGDKDNSISQVSNYYIARNKEALKVDKTKKSLIKDFPEITGLAGYMKKEKINIRRSKDLIKLVTYMNNN
jgi:hypothetical protein